MHDIPACLASSLFFFNDTATSAIFPLSLHGALPIPPLLIFVLEADGLTAFPWPLQLRCLGGRVAAQGKSFLSNSACQRMTRNAPVFPPLAPKCCVPSRS